MGEGSENEADLMPLISSCSIACGGHYGDEKSMRKTIRLAMENGVKIGAHPSYPDRGNFGRKVLKMESGQLIQSIIDQVRDLKKISENMGAKMTHIKPHGALYHEAIGNTEVAKAVISCLVEMDNGLELYAPFGSVIARLASQKGIHVRFEAFADRNYINDLNFVSRDAPDAMVAENKITDHVSLLVLHGKVQTILGNQVPIKVDTLCVHGDNPEALAVLRQLNEHFYIEK